MDWVIILKKFEFVSFSIYLALCEIFPQKCWNLKTVVTCLELHGFVRKLVESFQLQFIPPNRDLLTMFFKLSESSFLHLENGTINFFDNLRSLEFYD